MRTLRQILVTFGCLLAYFLIFAILAVVLSFIVGVAFAILQAL